MALATLGLLYVGDFRWPYQGYDAPYSTAGRMEAFAFNLPSRLFMYLIPSRLVSMFGWPLGEYLICFVLTALQWFWLGMWWKYVRRTQRVHWLVVLVSIIGSCAAGLFAARITLSYLQFFLEGPSVYFRASTWMYSWRNIYYFTVPWVIVSICVPAWTVFLLVTPIIVTVRIALSPSNWPKSVRIWRYGIVVIIALATFGWRADLTKPSLWFLASWLAIGIGAGAWVRRRSHEGAFLRPTS